MKRRKIIFRGKDYLIELYETFHSLPILHPLSLKKVTKLEDNERASRISRHGSSKKITKLQIFYKLDETREKSKLISSDWFPLAFSSWTNCDVIQILPLSSFPSDRIFSKEL